MTRFLNFKFDPESGELFDGGRRIPLEHQPAHVLKGLLAAPGDVVARATLIDAIWGAGTHVNFDDNLNYCIRHLRRVLGDDARRPRFIETLPRRGYRFIAPVTVTASAPSKPRPRQQANDWWPLAAAGTALFGFVLESGPNNHHEIMTTWLSRLHALVF
jgi:DNA-binding winged helix-turn-helix (wHTH) protein